MEGRLPYVFYIPERPIGLHDGLTFGGHHFGGDFGNDRGQLEGPVSPGLRENGNKRG